MYSVFSKREQMQKIRSLLFGKKETPPNVPFDDTAGVGGLGLIFIPGPDKGLYVKGFVPDAPAALAVQAARGPRSKGKEEKKDAFRANYGGDSGDLIRIGDCLLDIQEVWSGLSAIIYKLCPKLHVRFCLI